MFAHRITKSIDLHDGETEVQVVIRKLSARSLEKAADQKSIDAGKTMRAWGADLLDSIEQRRKEQEREKKSDPKQARYNNYDRESVLIAGIQSWTCEGITIPDGVKELDEETAELLFHEIIDLSLPPIDKEKIEQEEGKG